ncbi:MAG: hypothetical protein ACU83N_16260, partial [Gammaproteobacteria bacterium]
MISKKLLPLSAITTLSLMGNAALAHLNIAQEDAIAVGNGSREYKEGGSAFLDINVSHDCSNDAGEHFPTVGVTVLMPNGANLPDTYTTDHAGTVYGANAVMGIKQRVNGTFKNNIVVKGAVDPFYSHGVVTQDTRAMQWLKGKVDNDHYENLEFKTSFPSIDPESCVAKIKVYFPSMQYCTHGYKSAWIGTGESKYGMGDAKTHVYDTYAASITIVRTSDLPEACDEGEIVEARPTVEEINTYLDAQPGP